MPLPSDPKPWLFYRLGPAKEKKLFQRRRNTYDGVVIPAHIASYYATSCSEFIGSLGKPYFIDPMTYIFANDPSYLKRFMKDKKTKRTLKDRFGRKKKGAIKRSISKLVEVEYGGMIQKVIKEDRSIEPKDFLNKASTREFVEHVTNFQKDRLAAIPEKYKKYEKYAIESKRGLLTSVNRPMCIVAPYFPTRTLDARGWHNTNINIIQQTKEIEKDIPVFAVILGDIEIFNQHAKQIMNDYSKAGADGFLLWPDGFSSYKDSGALRIVFESVRIFGEGGKPVILMYGEAFSLALRFAGISGFISGICYGESKLSTKDIDIEGMIPPRYYLRRLKKKVMLETEARRIQIEQYSDLVCTCEICKRKPDLTTLDDNDSKEHFMLVRKAEIEELRNGISQKDFVTELDDAYSQHRKDPLLEPLGHLNKWSNLLSKVGNRRDSQ